ncbi:hypothetical protein E2I00_012868 [Balaenoptera physalus]|uniref:Uncharacterized protein n=1 Tax=Balaenoptera physalus TaxID=9770 RepID=A0A643CCF5_BALPH|nr:hypothetical protein E2I00_012868 [Balaenoptera physalus]
MTAGSPTATRPCSGSLG